MKHLVVTAILLASVVQLTAQTGTETINNAKVNLISGNGTSLFQSQSTNGIWGTGMVVGDRWGVFEDATSAKERLSILPGGNVGIGTSSPSNKLTIAGGVGNTPSILVRNTSYNSTNTSGTAALQFAFANHIGPKIEASKFTRNYTGLKFYTELGYNLPQLAMTLAPTNTGANVGIGTSNPTEKLEVYGGGNLLLRGANNNAGDILFQTNSKKQTGRIWTAGTGSSGLYMSSGDLIPDFTIDNSGNVGIGTLNTSAYKLSVDGNVRATEVKVYTGWADYVFAKDYKLPTLEEVAQHIEEKGHLINIPSAKEVEKDGILLGEMNAKLLEKIEELTLYTLKQQKQLEAQEKELNHQKTKNNSLEERLEKIELLLQEKK